MLKIIHVLTGVAALVLSFLPSLTGALPLLEQPEALALLFLGLLNVQFASFGPLHMHGRGRPVDREVFLLEQHACLQQRLLPRECASLMLSGVLPKPHLGSHCYKPTGRAGPPCYTQLPTVMRAPWYCTYGFAVQVRPDGRGSNDVIDCRTHPLMAGNRVGRSGKFRPPELQERHSGQWLLAMR